MTPRRPISRLALTVFLIAGALAPGARAALPDWARPIVEAAPPVPEGVPEHPSVVLFSEMKYVVMPDGSLRVRRRLAEQALSVNAESEVSLGIYDFDDTAKITKSKAWHVPPGERAKRNWSPPVDVAVGGAFLSDSKVRAIHVEGIKKGSIVLFEFEATENPYFMSISHLFYEGAPISLARFELETPPDWAVRSAWLRQKGPEPVINGGVRTWEMRDLPAPDDERLGVSPDDRAPLLAVNVVPPEGVSPSTPMFGSWEAFSRWYEDLIKGRHEPTPEVRAAARKVLDEAGAGFFDQVGAAGRFVRDKVRYVAVELGIGGVQPHRAAETLANLYGDCKDKGTLFRAFLSTAEIPTYPVLVHTSALDTVAREIPVGWFNHFVVAVAVPTGIEVPPAFAPALVDGGPLGRLLIVDTTDDRTSIGSLSEYLAGKQALVAAGAGGGIVVNLPDADPAAHRVERTLRLQVQPDRSMAIERSTTYVGAFASSARASYGSSSVERRQVIERRIVRVWPDATVEEYDAQVETPEGAFVEKVKARRRRSAVPGADDKIDLFPGAADDVERVALGKRKTPVDYGHAMTIRYDVTFAGIPPTSALPAAQSREGDGWSVRTEYARDAEAVKATLEIVLKKPRFEPEAFPELRKFWSAATSLASWTVSLGT